MCRSNLEGGRRCPHDGSDGRRARRINSQLKQAYTDEDVNPITEIKVSHESKKYSIEEVRETIVKFESTRALLEELSSSKKPWAGQIDGVKYPSLSQAFQALRSRLESLTREAGEGITSLAYQKTGKTAKEIAFYADSKQLELEEAYVNTQKEEQSLREEVVNKFKLSSGTFAFDNLAQAYFKDQSDPEIEALYKRWTENTKNYEEVRSKLLSFKSKLDGTYWKMVSENQKAYHDTLKEIRSFGGELQTSDDSHKEKSELLKQAASLYPTKWIESSNQLPPMKVKTTKARAHYNSKAAQKEVKVVPREQTVFKDADYTPSNSKSEYGMVKVEPDENGKYFVHNHLWNSKEEYIVGENQSLWVKPIWDFASPYTQSYDANGKPKGNGWEEIEISEKTYDPKTNSHVEETKKIWARQSKRRVTNTIEFGAEILVDDSPTHIEGKDKGWDCALHELAHRMEDAQPSKYLSILEEEFHKRRTTSSDGSRMKEIRLYKGKNEFGIPDDFVSDYMGKIYEDRKYFEILSTGMEAVFGSNYGNLHGVLGKKSDPDMKNFILGLLAVV